MEALRIFYTSFSSSERFRGTELMCLPSLPRLQSQARHIPALCLFILKICTEIKTSREKSMFLVPNLYAKIFLHPMTQNLHTKHGSYESQSTRILVPKNRMEHAWKKSVAPIRILARKIVPRNLSIIIIIIISTDN